jgi:hypothetical protein
LIVRSTTVERLVMLLSVFMLFYPGLFMDPLFAPYRKMQGEAVVAAIAQAPDGAQMRVLLRGTTLEGSPVALGVVLPLGPQAEDTTQRLLASGLHTMQNETGLAVSQVTFGSRAAKQGIEMGFQIEAVEVPSDNPAREWLFLPALALIGWVVIRQRRRRDAQPKPEPS